MQTKFTKSTFNRIGHSTNVSGIKELIVYIFISLLQFSLITSLQFFWFPTLKVHTKGHVLLHYV